jgi:small subunit ribosomal protein S6
MRDYELVFIVHPDLETAAFDEVVEKVQGWISEDGGEISKVDVWGKRKMAYPIRKKEEGQYVLLETKMLPTSIPSLERNLGLLEPVMRFLVTNKE